MSLSDWAFYLVIKASEWLDPMVHATGIAICVWAYRSCRKAGYLIIATYFAAVLSWMLYWLTIQPFMFGHSRLQTQSELPPETMERYQAELLALKAKYFPAAQREKRNVRFPIGSVMLVVGVAFLARREVKLDRDLDGTDNETDPR